MMPEGKIKHAFPGGNTSLGFYSNYEYILSQQEAARIIILKGGPGVGKSSFMKKTGQEMLDRGYDVEYMHCSSDNNSLDGVVIPKIKVALMDGTAPHVVDPKNPGAVDEIIHLGDFWNEEGLRKNREKILRDNREVGRNFARAYKYLKAAAAVYEDTKVINGWALEDSKVNAIAKRIIDDFFKDKGIAVKAGRIRKLFASAITPDGLKNYLDSILAANTVYVFKGQQGTGTEVVLGKIKDAAVERGYDLEAYYCALHPDKLEHILIPEMGVAFTTSNDYHGTGVKAYAEVDFNEFLDKSILNEYKEVIKYNKETFEALLNRAIATIADSKAIHDRMERYYIPNMDFEAVQRCWESTMARILEYAESI